MKIKYICEKCGTRYDTSEEAQKCEANHGHIVVAHVIPGKIYLPNDLCPQAIYVKFCNDNGGEQVAKYGIMGYADVNFDELKGQ